MKQIEALRKNKKNKKKNKLKKKRSIKYIVINYTDNVRQYNEYRYWYNLDSNGERIYLSEE